jgi:NAD(P)-dependent dehydrogenase (short-subunit alcohol dehydrogenase family)
MLDIFDLNGKVAIVTGGSSGIGFAIAEGLATRGAMLVIANRNADKGEAAVQRLAAQGLAAEWVPADVSQLRAVELLVTSVLQRHGQIDILVNSAGVILRKPVEQFSESEWDQIMNTNLRGAFLCCREIGRHMIARRQGKIINISSNVSQVIQPLRSVYCVSKAGLSHLTRALAVEWAQYGVNVNAIGPGPTITELNKRYFDENPADLKARVNAIPMGRMGLPADHVGAAVFLASTASDYMTGQTLIIDGGSNLL